MAQRNYLVEGLSGAGKSSVYEELIRRGYRAVSTDRAWKSVHPDGSIWNEQRALRELESPTPEVLFVCGSSSNRDRFLPYFTKVFTLRIDDVTMRRRLAERTNNDFGKEPEERELMLRLNRSGEKPAGAIDLDATRPLHQVVDDVLRLAGCEAVNSGVAPAPWSKSSGPTGSSFVRGRESSTRIEYAWAGHVLTDLLRYLEEQGIDLVSQTREPSGFVLTSDHRERYLARLDPSHYDGAVLRRYYEKLNETTADGVEYALLDGIAFLRDTLAQLEHERVGILNVE